MQSASALIEFSLHDLNEAKAANGDQHLGNLLRLLAALDGSADSSDGIQIDAAANTAAAQAIAGGKTLSFNQAEQAFAADPVIVALLNGLQRQLLSSQEAFARFTTLFRQSRSGSIALTSDDRRAYVTNALDGTMSPSI